MNKYWYVFIVFFLIEIAYSQDDDAIFGKATPARTLAKQWELDKSSSRGTFLITPYKPIYIMFARWGSNPNKQPQNTNPNNGTAQYKDWNRTEAEFQVSFKTKILQDFVLGKGDLWLAFTQKAIWQVYTPSLSRPFRELNYEPEIIFNLPLRFSIAKDFKVRMVGVGFNHQSNGREAQLSRSWNRIIFHAGMTYGNYTLLVRPWLRVPESDDVDENDDIIHYMGNGDVNLIYTNKGHIVSAQLRNNLNFRKNKGHIGLSWAYPVKDNLRLLFQVSHGYGDSMIDYNHKQTYIGIGFSLIEWL